MMFGFACAELVTINGVFVMSVGTGAACALAIIVNDARARTPFNGEERNGLGVQAFFMILLGLYCVRRTTWV